MIKVVFDTNVFLLPAQAGTDVFGELDRVCTFSYQFYTTQGVVNELKKLSEGFSKDARAARLGLSLVKKVKVIRNKDPVDNTLVELSRKGFLVVTQDVGVKRRLKKPYLTFRKKKIAYVVGNLE